MNGYASWVYGEEILRSNCSFWWSPDSRHIAFFKTDDRAVPVFTMADATGQHGVSKKQKYPKAGDKNPEIKIGVISLTNNQVTWADFNEHDDQYFDALTGNRMVVRYS
jgi:dipeptidyl-peptidase-4